MTLLNIIVSSFILALLTGLAGMSILRPKILVAWLQKQSRASAWLNANPFLFKPWYATFLRFMGIIALIFVVLSVMVMTGHGF